MPSQAGRLVLIQSVLQAIPIYFMGCVLLPKSFLHELNMIMANFWWGGTSSIHKMHWKSWDFLCLSNLNGGLGLRDMESFNLAMLASQ